MNQTVLLVTGVEGAEKCASAIGRQLGLTVELVTTRRAALAALRRREYAVVVLDETLAEANPANTEVLWRQAGVAIPVQVNLGISGYNRVLGEVRSAVQRREKELALAAKAAARLLEGELNTTIAGLLLQAELALAEPGLPPVAAEKLQQVVNLAGVLRHQLQHPTNADQ